MKILFKFALATSVLVSSVAAVRAQDDGAANPLEDVTQEMKVATNYLSKKTTDKQTQHPQEEAVSKLDKLIAALEKEKMGLGSGSSPNPTIPANASKIMKGPGGMGDLHGAREQGNRWGELPAHERDRILQSLTEGFPPQYQAILEAYYKRLAVEKRAEESDATPKEPKSQPKSETRESTPKTTQAAAMKPLAPTKKAPN